MTKEEFIDSWGNYSIEEKISLWNDYCNDCNMDEYVFDNDRYFFHDILPDSYDAIRFAHYGDYRFNDPYVWFNAYGNLESGNEPPFSIDDLWDNYISLNQ